MKKKKKRGPEWVLATLLGLICALVLGALFYGTMVYQLAGEGTARAAQPQNTPAPLQEGQSAHTLFPGALLALSGGELIQERAQDVQVGGESCRVMTRVYVLSDGTQIEAVSAVPAAYMERLAAEGWRPQLITGFTLAGLDAVYERLDDTALLAARDGGCVYMLRGEIDEQALYALGAGAVLEEEK